jgi:hypothetical protein
MISAHIHVKYTDVLNVQHYSHAVLGDELFINFLSLGNVVLQFYYHISFQKLCITEIKGKKKCVRKTPLFP